MELRQCLECMRYCLLFFVLVSWSCSNEDHVNDAALGCWTSSYEEENDNGLVYRPCDYKEFPVSWFRMTFDLSQDGTCEYLWLSPVDAHVMLRGTWSISDETLRIFDDNGDVYFQAKILSMSNDLLMLEIVN